MATVSFQWDPENQPERGDLSWQTPFDKVDLPICVCKRNLSIVGKVLSSKTITLPPGEYFFIAGLPTGRELQGHALILRSTKKISVTLAPAPGHVSREFVSQRAHFLSYHSYHHPGRSDTQLAEHASPRQILIRQAVGNVLEAQPLFFELCHWQDVKPQQAFVYHLAKDDYVSSRHLPRMVQILQPGSPTVNMSVPVSPVGAGIVKLKTTSDDRWWIETHLANSAAEWLCGYMRSGLLDSADMVSLSDALTVDRLLGGHPDPIAAVALGYALLRLGKLDRLSKLARRLSKQYPWLPDSLVIQGEYLARIGLHQPALRAFNRMSSRGLPLFTDGLSYIVERLDMYVHGNSRVYPRDQQQTAAEMQERLLRILPYVDFSCPMTTITGLNPALPDETVFHAESIDLIESTTPARAEDAAARSTLISPSRTGAERRPAADTNWRFGSTSLSVAPGSAMKRDEEESPYVAAPSIWRWKHIALVVSVTGLICAVFALILLERGLRLLSRKPRRSVRHHHRSVPWRRALLNSWMHSSGKQDKRPSRLATAGRKVIKESEVKETRADVDSSWMLRTATNLRWFREGLSFGLIGGAIVGLLFAPIPGNQMRSMILEWYAQVRGRVQDIGTNALSTAQRSTTGTMTTTTGTVTGSTTTASVMSNRPVK